MRSIFKVPSKHQRNTSCGKFQRFLNLDTRDRNGRAAARDGPEHQGLQITRAMARALCVILLLTHFCLGEAGITAEICQTKPKERHCVIESMSLSRWKHTNRYTFDWRTQRCYVMHWSNYCQLPTHESNNFSSEEACLDACAGWA